MADIRVVKEKRGGMGWLWMLLLLLLLAAVGYWLWSTGRLGGERAAPAPAPAAPTTGALPFDAVPQRGAVRLARLT